jgi:hypothetical protein
VPISLDHTCGSPCLQPSASAHSFRNQSVHIYVHAEPGMALVEGFPVGTRQATLVLQDTPTEVVRCDYSDAVLLFVTQTGSVGTVVQARWVLQAWVHPQGPTCSRAGPPWHIQQRPC